MESQDNSSQQEQKQQGQPSDSLQGGKMGSSDRPSSQSDRPGARPTDESGLDSVTDLDDDSGRGSTDPSTGASGSIRGSQSESSNRPRGGSSSGGSDRSRD